MVEEDEYRSTYRSVNQRRCVFEKAILTRRCACSCSVRFYLADREGVSCDSADNHQLCHSLLDLLREKARFAIRATTAPGEELPHAKEIKVQNGGLLGLQRILRPDQGVTSITDICGLTRLGERTFGSLEEFPFREIIKSIAGFEGRRRTRPRS
jgi:hypothetical protein